MLKMSGRRCICISYFATAPVLRAVMLALLTAVATPAQAAADSNPTPVVPLCQALRQREIYQGKVIVIVGRLQATDEGLWLSADCSRPIRTGTYAWPSLIFINRSADAQTPEPSQPYHWDKQRIRRVALAESPQRTRKSRGRWVAILGRFETRIPLQTALDGAGKIRGYGFGHLNGSPAQLIMAPNGLHEIWNEKQRRKD